MHGIRDAEFSGFCSDFQKYFYPSIMHAQRGAEISGVFGVFQKYFLSP